MNQSAMTMNSLNENADQMQEKTKRDKFGVCLLVTELDLPTGGVQSISFRLLDELNKRGHKTFVCCRNYFKHPRHERRNGTLIHRSPVFNRFFVVFNSLSFLIDGLIWLIRNRKEYDVIHAQQIFAPAMLGLFARTILGKPVLVGVHRDGELGEVNDLRKTPLRGLRLRQLYNADCWTVLSQGMREELESINIAPEKIKFVPNSTVIPQETVYTPEVKKAYRQKLDLPYEQIVIFTGRLSAEKGLDTLVQSWAKIRARNARAHLLIIGKGGGFPDVEAEIKALSSKLKLDESIHFLGFKPNAVEYMLAADVFVLPTLTEGMSVALIEAMATGSAIVTTDISANEYLCQNEENSLLVAPKDADALAAAIGRILDDSRLQERLGRAAREKAVRDLSVETMADRYLNLYAELIEKAKQPSVV